jgi:hypothetical protein
MADKRLKKATDHFGGSIRERLPFRDARGDIWIYRQDDDKQQRPLGPFFTAEYAMAASNLPSGQESSLVLTGRRPKPPFTPIKRSGIEYF